MTVSWYIKKYISRNGVEERTKYPVRCEYTTGQRARRAAGKAFARTDNAERQVARLLNNNFDAGRDIHVSLTYTDELLEKLVSRTESRPGGQGTPARHNPREDAGREPEALRNEIYALAQKELVNFIRRLHRELKKTGAEVRYLAVTSDMDPDSGEPARIHHHFVASAEAAEAIRRKWRGGVDEMELYNVNGDLSALASYLVRQVRPEAVEGSKRYVPSRSLELPYTEPPVLLVGAAAKYAENEMRLPRGCKLLYRSTYVRGAVQYIRYLNPNRLTLPKAKAGGFTAHLVTGGKQGGKKIQDAGDG